jgi:hypothetical protein
MINKNRLDCIGKNQQAVTLESVFDVRRQWMVNRKSTYEDRISKFVLLSECDWHVSAD